MTIVAIMVIVIMVNIFYTSRAAVGLIMARPPTGGTCTVGLKCSIEFNSSIWGFSSALSEIKGNSNIVAYMYGLVPVMLAILCPMLHIIITGENLQHTNTTTLVRVGRHAAICLPLTLIAHIYYHHPQHLLLTPNNRKSKLAICLSPLWSFKLQPLLRRRIAL